MLAMTSLLASAAAAAPSIELSGWSYQWERAAPAGPDGPSTVPARVDSGAWSALADPADPRIARAVRCSGCGPHSRMAARADPVVLIPKVLVAMQAYVDGRRSTQSPISTRRADLRSTQSPSRAVRDVITLRIFSTFTKIGLGKGRPRGSRAALLTELVRRDLPRLILVAFFALVAIGLVLLSIRGRRTSTTTCALFSAASPSGRSSTPRPRRSTSPTRPSGTGCRSFRYRPVLGLSIFVDGSSGRDPSALSMDPAHLRLLLGGGRPADRSADRPPTDRPAHSRGEPDLLLTR